MNLLIDIEPKEILLNAHKISINVLHIELNKYAIIRVQLYSEELKILQTNELIIDGDDYKNWNNDNYLIDFICSKYNYTLSN